MSLDHLQAILRDHALNPTPTGDDVVRYYVPFESLLLDIRIESALREAVEAGTRVAIVGPSGAGKSSLCEWVLGQDDGDVATVRIPVAVERDETVSDPHLFAQHVIRTVSQYALDASLMTPQQRDEALRASGGRIVRPGIQTTRRMGAGVSGWLLRGDFARDVTAFVESVDQDRSTTAILGVLGRLIDFIASFELRPVFLIDDSDAWLNIDGVTDRTGLISTFFGRVLRMLAELPAGLVVAVHANYFERAGFREQAEGFLERSVDIPVLERPDALAEIVLHRIRTVHDDLGLMDVFTDDAVTELHGYYGGAARLSVRRALQVAQRAVQLAVDRNSEVISREFVEAAVSDWV